MSRTLAVLLLVPGLGLMAHVDASASGCRSVRTLVEEPGSRALVYKVEQKCTATETSAGPTVSNAPAPPPCDIKGAAPATFCWGSSPCYYRSSVVPYAPPPDATRPTPDADWQVRICLVPDGLSNEIFSIPGAYSNWSWDTGTAIWIGQAPQPPSLAAQAREALGQIAAPTANLAFNPTNRTLVNLDTWFWAQGLTSQTLRGSSAFGLVAIATPDSLVVTPGDGSAPVRCAWVTKKSDRCAYAYRRSSVGGSALAVSGAPAYEASARATWSLRFETNGAPVSIPGAPAVLPGPAMTVPVEVTEVQTLVTDAG